MDRPPPTSVTTSAPSSLAAFRWLIPVVIAIAAVVALALWLPGVIDDGGNNKPGRTSTSGPGGAGNPGGHVISPKDVTAFDPEGDGTEHQELADLVTDGNATTGWHTQTYRSSLQSQNKPGVGLLFDLGSSVTVDEVRIASQTPGYSFELRAGDQPGSSEASFDVVKTTADAAGSQDVTFGAATHRYWLLWITSLPGGGAGTAFINEVKFFGSSG